MNTTEKIIKVLKNRLRNWYLTNPEMAKFTRVAFLFEQEVLTAYAKNGLVDPDTNEIIQIKELRSMSISGMTNIKRIVVEDTQEWLKEIGQEMLV